jgi:hypothetical protein
LGREEEVPVRITVVGPADLAKLQPLMRAYCDFYQIAPGDQALLELSQVLLADPQREGLQMLARDDTGQHLHGCGVQRPDRPRVPRPGGLPAGPVRDRATAGAVRPGRAHLRRVGPQHDREPGVAWADATHPRLLPLFGPEASQFFDPPETDTQFQAALGTVGLQSLSGQRLFAGASLVAAINSILGGAGLAVLAARVADLGMGRRWPSMPLSRWCCSSCTCCTNSAAAPISGSAVSWPDRPRITGRAWYERPWADAELLTQS